MNYVSISLDSKRQLLSFFVLLCSFSPLSWSDSGGGSFVKCVVGGDGARRVLENNSNNQRILHTAKVGLESTVGLIAKIAGPNGQVGRSLSSSSYVGCGCLLTVAHALKETEDPTSEKGFVAVNSDSIFDDYKNPQKTRSLKDYVVHPEYVKAFESAKNRSMNNSQATVEVYNSAARPYDVALVCFDDSLFENKKPIPIAREDKIIETLKMDGNGLNIAGFGRENHQIKAPGVLRIADLNLESSSITYIAGKPVLGRLKHWTGHSSIGDSGGPVFETRDSPTGLSSELTGVIVGGSASQRTTNAIFLTGEIRNFLRQAYANLTKGENCRNPF